MGLDPAKHLGKEIAFLKPYLNKLKEYVSDFLLTLSPSLRCMNHDITFNISSLAGN